jgi:2-keto-4-pentenoate hydratase/2-oxohepta-3-ene-1,7-dioic acid hydratase in catechol pathway
VTSTRFVRYELGGAVRYGVLEGDVVWRLSGPPWERPGREGSDPLASVHILAPCAPGKVLAVGLNYRSHLGDRPAPSEPGMFAKLPTSIIGPGEDIVFPPGAGEVHAEGEMVVVIGRTARRVSPERAGEHVFGVTAGNDVSERRWQRDDLQWFRAKGADTFGPLGPALVTGLDPGDLGLTTRLDGRVVQSARTGDLIFPVEEIVSWASRYVTLEPGDVIYTGTPGRTAALTPGDRVEVELEGVGVLENRVRSSD